MKKIKLVLLIWLLVGYGASAVAVAQSAFGKQILFPTISTDRYNMVTQNSNFLIGDSTVSNIFPFFNPGEGLIPKSPIMLGVKLNAGLSNYYSADVKSVSQPYSSYVINDGSEATIIALGINETNVADYRYRVIENDSVELVPWTKIKLDQKYGAQAPYGAIGTFRSPGKILMVEVQNIKKYYIRSGMIFDWRASLKPVLTQIEVNSPGSYFNLSFLKVNKGFATKFNPADNVPLDFKFPLDSVTGMRLHLKNHETVPYTIELVYKGKTTQLGYYNLSDLFYIDYDKFKEPGKYEILIHRVLDQPESQTLRIPFEVKPPPLSQKKVSIKQLIPYTVATLVGVATVFFIYRRQSNIKLRRAAQEKEVVGLKLQSIRSQLNPHFMFNALTSIQNLINKNNISGANYYLSKFAGLTRQVLDSSNEELLSLEDELGMLNDYLQMEQLRFNFKYEINIDEQLNQANIEIPAMLLQPFAENAIKHGISALNEDGRIIVTVAGEKNDLVLSVTDNGAGFRKQDDATGYGIKLSEDRVVLLNQIYKDQNVTLDIKPTQQGTTVTIRLSNWI